MTKKTAFKLKSSYCYFDLLRALKALELGQLQRAVMLAIASHAQAKYKGKDLCLTSDKQTIYPTYKALADEIGNVRGTGQIKTNTISRVVSSLSAEGMLLVLPSRRGNRFFIPKTAFLRAHLKDVDCAKTLSELGAELRRVAEYHKSNPKRAGGVKGQKLKPILCRLDELTEDVRKGRGRAASNAIQLAKAVHIFRKTASEKPSEISFLRNCDLRRDASQTCFWIQVRPGPSSGSIEPTYMNSKLRTDIYQPTYGIFNNGGSDADGKVGLDKFFEVEIFARFARALNQPQASDAQIQKFYAAYQAGSRSFADIQENLKTLETCPALEFNDRNPGSPHNLMRLLADPKSLANAAAAKRGELGKAYGFRKIPDMTTIVKISLDHSWRPEKTCLWLTGREADEGFLAYYREQKSRHDAEVMHYEQARVRELADNEALENRLKSEGPEFAEAARTMLRVIGKFRELGENLEKRFVAKATLAAILRATEQRTIDGIDPDLGSAQNKSREGEGEISKDQDGPRKGVNADAVTEDAETRAAPEGLRGKINEPHTNRATEAYLEPSTQNTKPLSASSADDDEPGFMANETFYRDEPEPAPQQNEAKPKPKASRKFKKFVQALSAGEPPENDEPDSDHTTKQAVVRHESAVNIPESQDSGTRGTAGLITHNKACSPVDGEKNRTVSKTPSVDCTHAVPPEILSEPESGGDSDPDIFMCNEDVTLSPQGRSTGPEPDESVQDYLFRACREYAEGDLLIWNELWTEIQSLSSEAEKIKLADEILEKAYAA